jgi:RNA polymerase sigma factor (sigma-70 family)
MRSVRDRSVTELVSDAAGGDPAAWDALVDRFAGTVWAVARGHRLSASDAADVSQTTWLRLVEHLDRIEQPDRIGGWLATTARRESLRVLRMAGRQVPTDEEFEPDLCPDQLPPDHALIIDERNRTLNDLVDRLPDRCQLMLRLLGADSPLSYRELSEALDMPIGSLGPTRARCLEHLRRLAMRSGLTLEDLDA